MKINRHVLCLLIAFHPKALILQMYGRSPGFPFANAFPIVLSKQWLVIVSNASFRHVRITVAGTAPVFHGIPF